MARKKSETRATPNAFFLQQFLATSKEPCFSEMSKVLEPNINWICMLSPLLIICYLTFMKFSFLICSIMLQDSYVCGEYKNEVSNKQVPWRVTDRFSSDEDSLLHQTLVRLCWALFSMRPQPGLLRFERNTEVIF